MSPDSPMANTVAGSLLASLFGGAAAGFAYILRLGKRVTVLETNTEARHEANLRTMNDIKESVDRIEDLLMNGRRRG